MRKKTVAALVCFLLLSMAGDCLAGVLKVSDFAGAGLEGWEEKKFKNSTAYRLSQTDGEGALLAESRDGASALIRKIRVDIRKFPFLNWAWRIETPLDIEDETIKAGDDYALRIYVVVHGGIFIWKTRAVNYVWAGRAMKGDIWENAFVGKNSMMMALRDRRDPSSVWRREKRNVYEDMKRLFGADVQFIDAVAIMTDTDNSHGHARAYYGDIFFSEK
ncbi:conserved exported hypothetical protein [Candidatus Desulfarcum epimagneticum]|uniref:DUF3047 domain-containing protein n=1 Tax=uncultured Desulfobacteraceae bacterium TaxID=218296 RepID=A0A484HJW6_9BACT|nr:conserved exported hypothetical protein [uncultured Desulfobacteraceae bacterium]